MKREAWIGILIAIAVIIIMAVAFVMIKIYMAPVCTSTDISEGKNGCVSASEDNESSSFKIRFTFRDRYVEII